MNPTEVTDITDGVFSTCATVTLHFNTSQINMSVNTQYLTRTDVFLFPALHMDLLYLI